VTQRHPLPSIRPPLWLVAPLQPAPTLALLMLHPTSQVRKSARKIPFLPRMSSLPEVNEIRPKIHNDYVFFTASAKTHTDCVIYSKCMKRGYSGLMYVRPHV
jgi:hypothetical protein